MKFCTNCGNQIADGVKFCTNCGKPVDAAPAAPAEKPQNDYFKKPAAPVMKPAAPLTPPAAPAKAAEPMKPAAPLTPPAAPAKAAELMKPAAPLTPPAAPAKAAEPMKPAAPLTPPAAPAKAAEPMKPAAPLTPPAAPAKAAEPMKPAKPLTPPASSVNPPVDEPPEELFAPSKPPEPKTGDSRRISPKKELKLLLHQGYLLLTREKRGLMISLMFPVLAALVTVMIAGKNMFVTYEATKSGCFVLVCAAIWGGLFNSIQTVVKERDNIKRDYVSGALRIECYIGSRAIIQVVLCAIQSAILCLSIPAITIFYGNDMPSTGAIGLPAILEFYITLFLVMYASDAMGLLVSSCVKKEALASSLAPYILIAQLLFSGVMFALKGFSSILSSVMISRWGMEAMGSICNLNNTPTRVYTSLANRGMGYCSCGILDTLQYPANNAAYESSAGHMLLVFVVMGLFVVVSLVAAIHFLRKVKNDGRG